MRASSVSINAAWAGSAAASEETITAPFSGVDNCGA